MRQPVQMVERCARCHEGDTELSVARGLCTVICLKCLQPGPTLPTGDEAVRLWNRKQRLLKREAQLDRLEEKAYVH